jgi:hypothetical protein
MVIGLAIVMSARAFFWYGITVQFLKRVWRQPLNLPCRAMSFRFVLQRWTGAVSAIHDGDNDAQAGRPTCSLTIMRHPQEHVDLPTRRINCNGQDHPSLTYDGRNIPIPGIQHALFGRGADPGRGCCFLSTDWWPGHASRTFPTLWYVAGTAVILSPYICSMLDRVSRGAVSWECAW